VLIDDLNMNRFLNPSSYQNPDKIAWSLGSRIDLFQGKLGFYFAGATRYTFESVSEEFYSYTLHAGSAIHSGGEVFPVSVEDQMLGYVHGENNVAFKANWSGVIAQLQTKMGMECVVSGSKAPTNPWHNGEPWAELGTQLLNDPVLEVKLLFDLALSHSWKDVTIFAATKCGYIFNELNAVYPGDSGYPVQVYSDGLLMEPIYVPKAGDSRPVAELTVGVLLRLQ